MTQKVTREEIIQCALDYFLKTGINNVSMFGIEKRVDCSRRTLYRHFENKMELMFEVYKIVFVKLSQEVIRRREAQFTDDAKKNLQTTINVVIDTFLNHPDEVRYIIEFDAQRCSSEKIQNAHTKLMTEVEFTLLVLKEGVKNGVIDSKQDVWQISFLVLESLMSTVYRFLTVNENKYASKIDESTLYHLGEILIQDILK